jgi:hypothetical protein
MHRIVLRRPSPSFVISCIALFVALGGVSYGVATGSINSREIKNNTIRSRDVRNGGLLGKDLKRATVGSREVRESRLGTVPRAASVDGHNLAPVSFRAPAGTPTRTILAVGGLIVNASCGAGNDLALTATTAANNAMIHVGTVAVAGGGGADVAYYADDNDFDIGQSVTLVPVRDNRVRGALTYTHPGGAIVDVGYLAEEQLNGLASANDCFVAGRATQSG